MKKICCLTTIETTMSTFVVPAMELFVKEGYEVTLICTMSEEFVNKYSDRFKCINVPMKRGKSFKDLLTVPVSLYKIFRREKFDYVQYATSNATLYAAPAAWLARIPHRVCCMWGISFINDTGARRIFFKLLKKIPCIFSNHISIPSHLNQLFGASEGLYKLEHSSVVGDGGTVGVNLSEFDFSKREDYKKEVLDEHPELRDKLVYGFLGRIWQDKGCNELLKAFLSMKKSNIALIFIGAFDTARGNLDADVLEKAKQTPNIIFHGFTKEVPKYLSVIDVLCHPSYHEGFSMAIQQAMAMGCAIVTTDIPGPSEVIENGTSGITVKVKTVEPLKEAMEKMLDPDLRSKYANAGLKRVRSKFSRERMMQLTYENRLDILNGKYDN